MMKTRLVILASTSVLVLATAAHAQQRPLVTEDPETIGAGNVLIEGGVDVDRDVFFPLSGLHGNLLRLPSLGASFGIGSIAELQVDGGIYQRLNITRREAGPLAIHVDPAATSTTSMQDLVIGTKITLLSETPGRPAVGVRLATKLPTANLEAGIGSRSMDFFSSLLLGKTTQSIRIVGNMGLGVLSDPLRGDLHDNVMTYGLSLARAVREGVEVVGEVNGRLGGTNESSSLGSETRGALRFGGRITRATVRVDGGLVIGMTSRDPSIGFTVGATWVFRGFTIP